MIRLIKYRRYGFSQRIGLGLILISFFACNPTTNKEENEKPNIVWITSEDNSIHYMSLFTEGGAPTPNIALLAKEGIQFNRAFSNAPVCSVARSTLITGCYAPRIGVQYHRKVQKMPLPENLKMFPAYLRAQGYYTSNNRKEDYNLIKSEDVWDDSSDTAHWKNRAKSQPFFHVQNFTTTHESKLHFDRSTMNSYQPKRSLSEIKVAPQHPKTDLFRYTQAYYQDKIREMDSLVGLVIEELRADQLMENTIIFYFGDHGGVLPGSKGYLKETGLHVPLVVYLPEKYRKQWSIEGNTKHQGFVEFMDFAPTVLHLAGIPIPATMDGQPFLGSTESWHRGQSDQEAVGYADRFDEKYDMVRSYREGRYKYIRNFQPFNPDGLWNNYRYKQLAYQEWDSLAKINALNEVEAAFFKPKPVEQLYDLSSDPYETINLAEVDSLQEVKTRLRQKLYQYLVDHRDLSFFPESVLLNEGAENPGAFGQENQAKIQGYATIANLALESREKAEPSLMSYLGSQDPWERYWAINSLASFTPISQKAMTAIEQLLEKEENVIVRARGIQSLILAGKKGMDEALAHTLYAAKNPTDGLLILNIIVMLRDTGKLSNDNLDSEKIQSSVKENDQVQRRLDYLGLPY